MTVRSRRAVIVLLDALILFFGVVALVMLDTGGGTFRLAGMKVTAETLWRPFGWFAGLLVLRLAVDRASGPFGRPLRFYAAQSGLRDAAPPAGGPLPSWREVAAATAGLALAIAAVLHQQVVDLYRVPDYGDPLFSMWRLGWVAHQLLADPRHLFDANIFYPLTGTLTYSDSMLLTALVTAPFIWAGVPIALVYQGAFFSAFLLSGVATFALARVIGLGRGAAWIAALIFALCQYRMEHFSHLELQVAHWMPLTLLAGYQWLAAGQRRYAVWLGLALAAQWYSSMYYGVFLTIYAGVFVVVLALAWRSGWRRTAVGVAALGLGVALVLPLARVYRSTEAARGTRTEDVVAVYSAKPIDWIQPNTRSRWYRDLHLAPRDSERELFPNVMPLALAVAGVVPPLGAAQLAMLVAGLVAFDGSLGPNGHWYGLAYLYLSPLKSMRVPARFAMLVNLSLALLAGTGVARLLRRIRTPRGRQVTVAAISVLFVVESLPDLELRRLWKSPPPLYGTLGAESGAVLFEFPIHGHWDYFGENLPYMYFSTWHWTRMVNGYSGFVPQSYQDFTVGTAGFPLGDTVEFLQRVGVTHVGLHCALWDDDSCALTIERLAADPRFRLVTAAQWQGKPAHLYELQR